MKIPFCILGPASVGARIAILFVLASAFSLQLNAQTNSAWTGGTGNWSNASDWTNGVPNGNYNALISNGGPVSTVNLDINSTIANLGLDTGNTLNILPANTLTFQSASGSTINGGGTINLASGGGITIGAGNSLSAVNPTGGSSASFNMGGPGSFINGATGTESFTAVTVNGSGTISNLQANIASLTASGGTLTVNPNSKGFSVGESLAVAAGSTLNITGGTFTNYNATTGMLSNISSGCCGPNNGIILQGTLQFDNANITELLQTRLTLDGPGARIVNQSGQNGLANLDALGFGAYLSLINGANLSLNGNFGGTPLVASGSTLNIAGDLSFSSSPPGVLVDNAVINVAGNVNAVGQPGYGPLARVTNGGTLNVQGNYTNYSVFGGAALLSIDSGSVHVGGNFTNTGISFGAESSTDIGRNTSLTIGGSLTNSGSASLAVSTGAMLTVAKDLNNTVLNPNTNQVLIPGLNVSGPGANVIAGGSLNNSGNITVDNSASITAKGGFNQTAGSTQINGGLTAGGTGVTLTGGTFNGTGTINGNMTNAAALAPGALNNANLFTGTLTINGNYIQTSSGTLAEAVGMLNGSNATLLSVNGAANLNGTLALSLLSGAQPTVGETFTLMTFASDTGTFSNVTGTNLGNNEVIDLIYNPTDILAEVASTSGGGTTSAPEPGSALLLVLALIPATLILRRQAVRI